MSDTYECPECGNDTFSAVAFATPVVDEHLQMIHPDENPSIDWSDGITCTDCGYQAHHKEFKG